MLKSITKRIINERLYRTIKKLTNTTYFLSSDSTRYIWLQFRYIRSFNCLFIYVFYQLFPVQWSGRILFTIIATSLRGRQKRILKLKKRNQSHYYISVKIVYWLRVTKSWFYNVIFISTYHGLKICIWRD